MEFLVILIIIALLYIGFPQREFYLVEIRYWSNGVLKSHSRNYSGYTRQYMRQATLKIKSRGKSHAVLCHSNQGMIKIEQYVFSSLQAAQIYFESLKPQATSLAIEMYLWRTVARTRAGAYIIPPRPYLGRGTVLLLRHQPYLAESAPQLDAEFSRP